MKTYYVYIMASTSRVLYVGITSDLLDRVHQHKHRTSPGFTAQYNVSRLVYYEVTTDVRSALVREKEIKKWRRSRKVALVESLNPCWKDLSEQHDV